MDWFLYDNCLRHENLENSYLHKHNQIRAFLINNAFFCLGVDTYNQQ